MAARGAALGVTVVLPELVRRAASACPFVTPVVGPQGAVSPCPALSYARDVPLRPQPVTYARRVFGTLPERSFEAIWNDPAYVAFREQASCGSFRERACAECLVATGVICPK
ncbi:MAG: SPASM domain-containing protein [Deltaproteobacteria bacterium]|nr:SPASM domain-containing protein [Deltaproteobacteria bacterium]